MTVSLRTLRDDIARIEGFSPPRVARGCPTGWPALDAALPGGGLMRGALHEILSPDLADGAAMGFAIHLMGRFQATMPERVVLWASCRPDLFGPGLKAAGIDPGRFLIAKCQSSDELLFVIEECSKSKSISVVSSDIGEVDFSLSRRLQLAAAGSGATLILLRPARFAKAPSAAVTRWHAEARPGGGWSLGLFRCRGGRPGHWRMPGNANDNRSIIGRGR